jgi:hypothetical protein
MAGTLGGPNVALLVDLTYNDADLNYIDDPSNLKDDRVFVYSGKLGPPHHDPRLPHRSVMNTTPQQVSQTQS